MGKCGCCKGYPCDLIIFKPVQVLDLNDNTPRRFFSSNLYDLPFPLKYNSNYFKNIEDPSKCQSSLYTATGVYFDLCSCSNNSHSDYPNNLTIKNNNNILINDNYDYISNTFQKYKDPFRCNCNSKFDYSRTVPTEFLAGAKIIDPNGKEFLTENPKNGKLYFASPYDYGYMLFRNGIGNNFQRFYGSGDIISASMEMCKNNAYLLAGGYIEDCNKLIGTIGLFTSKINFLDPIEANLWELTSIPRNNQTFKAIYPICYTVDYPPEPPEVIIATPPVQVTIVSNTTSSCNAIPLTLWDTSFNQEYCGIKRISNKALDIAKNTVNIMGQHTFETQKTWDSYYYKEISIDYSHEEFGSFIVNIPAPDLEDFNLVTFHRGFLPPITKPIIPLSTSKTIKYKIKPNPANIQDYGRSYLSFSGEKIIADPKYFDKCGNLNSGYLLNGTFCSEQPDGIFIDPLVKNTIQYGFYLYPFGFYLDPLTFLDSERRIMGVQIFPDVPIDDSNLYAYYVVTIAFGSTWAATGPYRYKFDCSIPFVGFPNNDASFCTGKSARVSFSVSVNLIIHQASSYVYGNSYSCFSKNGNCITINCPTGPPYPVNIQPYDAAVAFGGIEQNANI